MKRIIICILLAYVHILYTHAQEDSLQANRYVMRATLYGIGHTNVLDTYLSPMEYTGPEFRFLRESMRMTRLMDGQVSTQSLFQAHVALTENRAATGSELAFMANWNYAWHYQFHINENLKLLAGPLLDINGGFVYNLRNSNNPVQAKAYINVGASGMAIYRFKIKDYPMVLRYQANLPLLGVMFSPEYGQAYYEMSLSHDWGKNLCFTSLHNQPALRQLLTLDFPVKSANLRVGYLCDIQQAKVNELKSHIWSHVFMIGFVKNFYVFKGRNRVSMPLSVSPY
ncbi:MAG: DUF3316 domain-containing protein [Bacteroides sp.]|nr:DUF3316 domain-containing protein [Bacteroides sp.]